MRVEIVEFNGVTFRRYPDSPQWGQRCYFTPGIADRERGVKRLHEEIWIAENGPIPDGCQIHHSDFDPLNNDLANLVCLTRAQHDDAHRQRNSDRGKTAERLARLEAIRPLAVAWHRSPEGKAWHREHGRRTWEGRESRYLTCEHCRLAFQTLSRSGNERFCSNACKSAWRRASGADNEMRTCEYCHDEFTVNRYSKVRFCSRSCASKAARSQT